MSDLVINIRWEYFLGFIGSSIAFAYYANGRFTRIETDVQWLAEAIRDLTVKAENISAKLFDVGSPVALTTAGRRLLERSGLKSYIDGRRDGLLAQLEVREPTDLYAVQDAAFRLLGGISLDEASEQQLNKFAFENGMSTDLLRRVGAIYLRDIAAKIN
jgi:hypothetical protein